MLWQDPIIFISTEMPPIKFAYLLTAVMFNHSMITIQV